MVHECEVDTKVNKVSVPKWGLDACRDGILSGLLHIIYINIFRIKPVLFISAAAAAAVAAAFGATIAAQHFSHVNPT